MDKRLRLFFEFRIPLISYFLFGIVIFILFLFNHRFQPLSTMLSQFGCFFIVSGFCIRLLASITTKYLGKIKITGIYALCRQPMLLAQIFVLIGFNLIVFNPFFLALSLIIFLSNDCVAMYKYDKILAHYYREVWQIYKSQTRFLLPITNRVNDVLHANTSVNEIANSSNTLIFLIIYALLVEIAMFSYI